MVKIRSNRRDVLKSIGGAGAVGMAGLAGCLGNDEPDEPDAPDAPDEPDDELTEVVIGHPQVGLWDTTIPYIVGNEEGFFEDEGLDVSTIDVAGGGENVRAVVAGDAQVGMATGLLSLLAAYRDGTDIRVVGNQWSSASDLFWYALADSPYDSLEDATDASIAFSRPGSSTHMVALGAIDHGNLTDAEPVSTGGPPDTFAAVMGEEVDLGWSVPPFFFDEIEAGNIKRVFTGAEVPPFDDLTIRAHFASADWVEEDPDTARALFRAWNASIDWAYDNLEAAAEHWGNFIDEDDTDLLLDAVEQGYPKEHMDPAEIRNLDVAMDLGVEHDFIDTPLSEEEQDELFDLSFAS